VACAAIGECFNYAFDDRAGDRASENHAERTLERRITVFRELEGGFRRSDELHRLRLYDAQSVLEALANVGFDARRLAAYGNAVHFGRGHSGFLATKRG